jgi:predicted nuclease of predicted toxin-antitoxin system
MRILLDECLPARLKRDLPGHEVQTVPQAGWAGIHNGELLRLVAASGRFDVFLTVDKQLPQQNDIKKLPFAVVVLRAQSNDILAIRPFAPGLLRRFHEFSPGHVYVLNDPV